MTDEPAEFHSIVKDLQRDVHALRAENAGLSLKVARLVRENATLRRENATLREELDKTRRDGKRQATPFSRGQTKPHPKRPGRKPGKDYGRRAERAIPKRVDRVLPAPVCTGVFDGITGRQLCPDCWEPLFDFEVHTQYQTDIPPPPPPEVTRFDVHTARCSCCGKRFQGRHPEQTSDALGAASNQIGPRALAMTAQLKYEFGMSFGKIRTFIEQRCGLLISRSTPARAAQRMACKAEPTYFRLVMHLRRSRVVCADETGWKVAAERAWLWVFTDDSVTVYAIDRSRGHEVVERILGETFGGTLSSDCFLAYDPVEAADKQKCNAHLLKTCREIETIKSRGAVRFSRKVAALLRAGIALHRRRDKLTPHGFAVQRGKLEAAMDRLLRANLTDPDNARLAKRLRKYREHLFTYLRDPAGRTDPTNNAAEREIRPMVVNRKMGACNRTKRGARTTAILGSLIRTCKKQGRRFTDVMEDILHAPAATPHPFTRRLKTYPQPSGP